MSWAEAVLTTVSLAILPGLAYLGVAGARRGLRRRATLGDPTDAAERLALQATATGAAEYREPGVDLALSHGYVLSYVAQPEHARPAIESVIRHARRARD